MSHKLQEKLPVLVLGALARQEFFMCLAEQSA